MIYDRHRPAGRLKIVRADRGCGLASSLLPEPRPAAGVRAGGDCGVVHVSSRSGATRAVLGPTADVPPSDSSAPLAEWTVFAPISDRRWIGLPELPAAVGMALEQPPSTSRNVREMIIPGLGRSWAGDTDGRPQPRLPKTDSEIQCVPDLFSRIAAVGRRVPLRSAPCCTMPRKRTVPGALFAAVAVLGLVLPSHALPCCDRCEEGTAKSANCRTLTKIAHGCCAKPTSAAPAEPSMPASQAEPPAGRPHGCCPPGCVAPCATGQAPCPAVSPVLFSFVLPLVGTLSIFEPAAPESVSLDGLLRPPRA